MIKYYSFVFCLLAASFSSQAQYTVSVTYQHTFTASQVDSILTAQVGSFAVGAFNIRYAVKLYKVIYHSYGADSIPTTASGLLVVPQGTPCEVPMVSFQHTNIIKKSDAPSSYGSLSEWYIGVAAGAIGNISLMPDGIGLGSGPGRHPFLHLQSEATSVIDMIRAVKEIVDTTGAMPNEQLFLAGISEGASASIAAHQYIQTYLDSTMHVTASGGIAGYFDMSGTMVNMMLSDSTYPDPSYLPELLLTYDSVYGAFAADSDMMIYPYDSVLPPLFNGNNRGTTIDTHMPTVPKNIMQPALIDSLQNDSTYFFRQLLARNNFYNWIPTSPIYLYYCMADEYVPYQNSTVAAANFAANGSTMVTATDAGPIYDHEICAETSVVLIINVINTLIHQPIVATIAVSNNTSPTTPNGTVTVSDSLGDPPYTWRWSTGDSTATVTGLAAGTYYVTTTDVAHCTNIDTAVVLLADGINEVSLVNISIYPNPTQGLLMIENKNNSEILTQIEILDISGHEVNAPQTQTGNITVLNLGDEAKGIYFLNVRSQSGKSLHQKVVLL